jgi:hypothetical protein
MPLRSITTHRFNMTATVLRQGQHIPDPVDPTQFGEYVEEQDPITGEITRVWRPYPDVPDTPDVDESVTFGTIRCMARGIVDGGIRVAGTTERFGADYENVDYVKLWFPVGVKLSKRDRITNIRNRAGQVFWVDEEYDDNDPDTPPRATMFNVNGVTPLFDAYNNLIENYAQLERADDLGDGVV